MKWLFAAYCCSLIVFKLMSIRFKIWFSYWLVECFQAASYEGTNKKFELCRSSSIRYERQAFGVTTFIVSTHNCEKFLYRKKRAVVPLIQAEDGTISYIVELTYPRTWRHKDVPITAKVGSDERGYPQTLEVRPAHSCLP
jgi:hypothetical protein